MSDRSPELMCVHCGATLPLPRELGKDLATMYTASNSNPSAKLTAVGCVADVAAICAAFAAKHAACTPPATTGWPGQ